MVNVLTPAQKQQKADLIAIEAGKIFQKKGFNQISMNEIAQQAGMSKGTLFNYYPTKEDLFMTVLLVGYQKYFYHQTNQLQQAPLGSVADFKKYILTETKNLIENFTALIRLNAIRGPILESNSDRAQTLKNRQKLYDVSLKLSQLIHDQVPELAINQINHLFVVQSSIISGLLNLANLDQFDYQPTEQSLPDFQIDVVKESQLVLSGYLREVLGG